MTIADAPELLWSLRYDADHDVMMVAYHHDPTAPEHCPWCAGGRCVQEVRWWPRHGAVWLWIHGAAGALS